MNNIAESKRKLLLYFVVCIISFFRFSYMGFRYTPYLDDYIQYSFYPSYPMPWQNILVDGVGVLFTRPLAGLFDYFLWSRFFGSMGVLVAHISVLYGASAILFCEVLKKCNIGVGAVFVATYLFLPINVEGTYWISASTRIVFSMFLIALSLFFAANKRWVCFYIINFLSMWFYEQTAILSVVATTMVGIFLNKRRIVAGGVISFAILTLFYLFFGRMGDNADRLTVAGLSNVFGNIKSLSKAVAEIFVGVQLKIVTKGFIRGIVRIVEDFSILWLGVLVIMIMYFLNLSYAFEERPNDRRKLTVGIVLFFAPLAPFLVTEHSLNLRNIVPSLVGVGILVEMLVNKLPHLYKNILAALMIFFFSISTVSEVCDYNKVAESDYQNAKAIAQKIDKDTKYATVNISTPKYLSQNAPWNDHIISMVGSDWAPTGIVRTISKNREVIIKLAENDKK